MLLFEPNGTELSLRLLEEARGAVLSDRGARLVRNKDDKIASAWADCKIQGLCKWGRRRNMTSLLGVAWCPLFAIRSRKLAKLAGVTLAIARFLSTGCKS